MGVNSLSAKQENPDTLESSTPNLKFQGHCLQIFKRRPVGGQLEQEKVAEWNITVINY
jgi:hypothetical protein